MRETRQIIIGNSPYRLHASADNTGCWSGYIAPNGDTGMGTRGRVSTIDQAMADARRAAERHYSDRQQSRQRPPLSGMAPLILSFVGLFSRT